MYALRALTFRQGKAVAIRRGLRSRFPLTRLNLLVPPLGGSLEVVSIII